MMNDEKLNENEILDENKPAEEEANAEQVVETEVVEEGNPNEDDFLDEHPIEQPAVEEVKEEPKPEEAPKEEPEEEEIPRRPKQKSYEYDDERLAAVENARILWNKSYRRRSLVKMIIAVAVLAVIVTGWLVPTLTMPNAGPTPLYISLGIAGVGIVAILIVGFFQKKKDREGIAQYFVSYYNSVNDYVFDGLNISALQGTYEDKVSEAEVEACGLYPGFTQVGSRDNITFTYMNMDCALADMAVQKNAVKGLQTVFVGKFLRTHNTMNFPTDGRLIIYFKGNKRSIPPLAIEGQTPLEEHAKYAVYGPAPLKKVLTHRLKTELNQIQTDALLVDVAISIEPGRTFWSLGYEDDLMVLPNQDAFDPYYVMEHKKQLKTILDIALMMNESSEN